MDALSGFDIVCFAIRPWDSPWKNNQQVMSRLATANRVLYVNPPRPLRDALRRGVFRKPRPSQAARQETLHVLQESLLLPRWGKSHFVARQFNRRVDPLRMAHARNVAGSLGFRAPILWIYDPLAADALGKFRERVVVYSVVDSYVDYFVPEEASWRAKAAANHQTMLRRADVVFAVSEALWRECLDVNRRSFLMPNAVDVDLFQNESVESLPGLNIRGPVIGYVGVLTEVIDLGLLEYIAMQRPRWSLLLVGPTGVLPRGDRDRLARLIALPNVHYVGAYPVDQLPAFVAHCDVALMPYRLGPLTLRGDSLKLYEYMACGKPIVSTALPCARRFPGLVEVAENAAEFVKAIEQCLQEPPEKAIARRHEAKQHSWTRRIEAMATILAAQLNGSR